MYVRRNRNISGNIWINKELGEHLRDDMKTFKMKTSESTNIKSFISQLQWGQDRSSLARST